MLLRLMILQAEVMLFAKLGSMRKESRIQEDYYSLIWQAQRGLRTANLTIKIDNRKVQRLTNLS